MFVSRSIQNRNVFDFVSESFVVHYIMQKRGISHETYRKLQNDVDYVVRYGLFCLLSSTSLTLDVSMFWRLYNLVRQGWMIVDTQARVMAVLHLPNFQHEAVASLSSAEELRSITIRTIRFVFVRTHGVRLKCLLKQVSLRQVASMGTGTAKARRVCSSTAPLLCLAG